MAVTQSEFDRWAAELQAAHPEMFNGAGRGDQHALPARRRWHPLFLRVYGIQPWEIGRYTLREYGALVEDLEKHGLGGGLGG